MNSKFFVAAIILVAVFFLPIKSTFAQTTTPTSQELEAMMKQLQEQVKQLQKQILQLQATQTTISEPASTASEAMQNATKAQETSAALTEPMNRGTSGTEVQKLQKLLKEDSEIYPEGIVTGYFGSLTEAAVRRFQEKRGIQATGMVDTETLAQLNKRTKESIPTSPLGTTPTTPAVPAVPSSPTSLRTTPAVPATSATSKSILATTPTPVTLPKAPAVQATIPITQPILVPTSTSKSSVAVPPPPGWSVVNTGINHTIAVTVSSNPSVNGASLESGDYIGVFYRAIDGNLKVGGFSRWEGSKNINITAWGDDVIITPNVKDGFASGEQFVWKIWKNREQKFYSATASFLPKEVGVTATNAWEPNGISVVSELKGTGVGTTISASVLDSIGSFFKNLFGATPK